MSADNYLYVRKVCGYCIECECGEWAVTMEFMSDDEVGPVYAGQQVYKTWVEAYKAAQKWEQEEPYGVEYGIHSDPAE